jgi:hypothetical protein
MHPLPAGAVLAIWAHGVAHAAAGEAAGMIEPSTYSAIAFRPAT